MKIKKDEKCFVMISDDNFDDNYAVVRCNYAADKYEVVEGTLKRRKELRLDVQHTFFVCLYVLTAMYGSFRDILAIFLVSKSIVD